VAYNRKLPIYILQWNFQLAEELLWSLHQSGTRYYTLFFIFHSLLYHFFSPKLQGMIFFLRFVIASFLLFRSICLRFWFVYMSILCNFPDSSSPPLLSNAFFLFSPVTSYHFSLSSYQLYFQWYMIRPRSVSFFHRFYLSCCYRSLLCNQWLMNLFLLYESAFFSETLFRTAHPLSSILFINLCPFHYFIYGSFDFIPFFSYLLFYRIPFVSLHWNHLPTVDDLSLLPVFVPIVNLLFLPSLDCIV